MEHVEGGIKIYKQYRSTAAVGLVLFSVSAMFFTVWKVPKLMPHYLGTLSDTEALNLWMFFAIVGLCFVFKAVFQFFTFIELNPAMFIYSSPLKRKAVPILEIDSIQEFVNPYDPYTFRLALYLIHDPYLLLLCANPNDLKKWPGWGPINLPVGLSNRLLLHIPYYDAFTPSDLAMLIESLKKSNPRLTVGQEILKRISTDSK